MTDNFEALREKVLSCTACRLCEGRTKVVFGVGNPKARVMVIGEGPGREEDLKGEPFVGRSGQLMDKMLGHVGLTREKNIFIGNMVKCRPPENRDPRPDEVEICIEYLREQVRLIRPKIIVCMGRVAAISLIDPNFKVTQQHGQFIEKNGILMMGTFHPAALLRNPGNKPAALQDMLNLQQKIMEVCPETYEE
ncbi:MAG: uracil-DNA glycosylase [Oscillospiraceae bacterium]|nr:uracil-DNA glycosylase [Oscillospiraceae bacterium]